MSATYRIDAHDSAEAYFPWKARIIRLSDEKWIESGVGLTKEEAVNSARSAIVRIENAAEPETFYVDDQGRDAEAPQSVKV